MSEIAQQRGNPLDGDLRVEREQGRAISLSLLVGVLMLAGKGGAYWITGSAAILSDAAESVIHNIAVLFAALSIYLMSRPRNGNAPYGYDRMAFFSAGFEGGMIVVAALWIIVMAVQKWRAGLVLEQLGYGALLVLAASCINLALGWHLVRTGRRNHSIVLEANGAHVLTDSWTSFGVVAGLGLVLITGWKPFDPLCAIAVALNIFWSGGKLIQRSFRGLLDLPDPGKAVEVRRAVAAAAIQSGAEFHRLRFRDTGHHMIVSLHLLLPAGLALGEAHRRATRFERDLAALLPYPLEVVTHLEALEDHATVHPNEPASWS